MHLLQRGLLLIAITASLLIDVACGATWISVDASLRAIPNSLTSVSLVITNPNDGILNILQWNSILEDFPVAELPLNLISDPANDAFPVTVGPRAHANYVKVLASHFIRILPRATYTQEIDLRRWYAIKFQGTYRVELKDYLRGFLEDQPLLPEPVKRSDVYKLARISLNIWLTTTLAATGMPPGAGNMIQCTGPAAAALTSA